MSSPRHGLVGTVPVEHVEMMLLDPDLTIEEIGAICGVTGQAVHMARRLYGLQSADRKRPPQKAAS